MAFQFSGAILTAYFLSLVIFTILPAQGPFIDASLPPNTITASIQHSSLNNATILYHHRGWIDPPRAYYVAFPSMHLAQPLIAAWFLRRWRGVSAIVCAFCALLAVAIVILRWHYLVDIVGGLVVAVLAVWIVSPIMGHRQPSLGK
jgi:membrane-associated phospholipid phosphatase